MISNTPLDKPCKTCSHRWDEHYEPQYMTTNDSKCRVVTGTIAYFPYDEFTLKHCKCQEYKEMPNLQYLEYLYDKRSS
jgi:hypothetical protein